MAISSINIQAVKPSSEIHNTRKIDLDYVRKDLTYKNYSWIEKSITDSRKELEQIYKEKIGQKMQKKATPIREGVFLLEKRHTNEELLKVVKKVEEVFGIKAIQLHVHRDEGYYNKEKEWIPNLHAHVVFEWNNRKTGKSFKLNREDMSKLQDFFSEALKMERGKSSSKKHLNALEWKNKQIKEVNKYLTEEMIANIYNKAEKEILKEFIEQNPKIKAAFEKKVFDLAVKYSKKVKKHITKPRNRKI